MEQVKHCVLSLKENYIRYHQLQINVTCTLPSVHDYVTMAAEYKRMPNSNMNVIKHFQINKFHKFDSYSNIISSLCMFRMLSEVF